MSQSLPLAHAVGRQMRGIRDEHAVSADDVAEAARGHGLQWQRSTVASVETGKRGLSAEELLLLPAVLSEALRSKGGGRNLITLAGVLNVEASLGDDVLVTPQGFRDTLAGAAPTLNDWQRPRLLAKVRAALGPDGHIAQGLRRTRQLWPEIDVLDDELMRTLTRASKGEAEQKAARALGVSAWDVTVLSWRLWCRSLADERDRLAGLGADSADTPRTTQTRRGHITRRLVAEIRQTLEEIGEHDGQRQ